MDFKKLSAMTAGALFGVIALTACGGVSTNDIPAPTPQASPTVSSAESSESDSSKRLQESLKIFEEQNAIDERSWYPRIKEKIFHSDIALFMKTDLENEDVSVGEEICSAYYSFMYTEPFVTSYLVQAKDGKTALAMCGPGAGG